MLCIMIRYGYGFCCQSELGCMERCRGEALNYEYFRWKHTTARDKNTNNRKLGVECHQLLQSEGGGLLVFAPLPMLGSGGAGSAKHLLETPHQPIPAHSPQSGIWESAGDTVEGREWAGVKVGCGEVITTGGSVEARSTLTTHTPILLLQDRHLTTQSSHTTTM